MRKILILLLAMVVLASSIPTYATELSVDSQTAQSTVYCLVESSFCVIIPKNIDCSLPFQLTADSMNLRDGEQVNVYLNGGTHVTLSNDSGETLDAVFTANGYESEHVGAFTSGQLQSSIDVLCQPSYDTIPRAGIYKGTVEFIVRVETSA